MLRRILAISGRPGLFKLVSQGKNMLIVEEIGTGKRTPAYATEKIITLNDIAIYTNDGEVSLASVLENIKKKEEGKETSVKPSKDVEAMREYMAEILPEFDRERVHNGDIKKLLTWYNILINGGITEFVSAEQTESTEE